MALILDVVVLGQLWNQSRRTAQLPQLRKHNLCPAIVFFEIAMDLNHPVFQVAHIANILQMPRKYDNRKRANPEILTEIEKRNAARSGFYSQYFSGHTLGFADVGLRLGECNAIARRNFSRNAEEKDECKPAQRHISL